MHTTVNIIIKQHTHIEVLVTFTQNLHLIWIL